MELLLKELHNNNHLTILDIAKCGLSVKGTCYMLSYSMM